MSDNEIYLLIAGFVIRVKLLPCKIEYMKEHFLRNIRTYMSGFLVKDRKENVSANCTVYVAEHALKLHHETVRDHRHSYVWYLWEYKGKVTTFYNTSITQFGQVLAFLLQNLLLQNKGFFLHASAVRRGEKALVFTGPSGAGKSTAGRLLKDTYTLLADETLIIRQIKSLFYVYQSPIFDQTHYRIKQSAPLPLEGIYFLRQSRKCKVKRLANPGHIIEALAGQIFTDHRFNPLQTKNLLSFVKNFTSFYEFYFSLDKNALLQALAA